MRPDGRAPRVKANLRREEIREEEPEQRTLAPFVEQFFASPSSPKPFIFTVGSSFFLETTVSKNSRSHSQPQSGFPRTTSPRCGHAAHRRPRGVFPSNRPTGLDLRPCHRPPAPRVSRAKLELPSETSKRSETAAEVKIPGQESGGGEKHGALLCS